MNWPTDSRRRFFIAAWSLLFLGTFIGTLPNNAIALEEPLNDVATKTSKNELNRVPDLPFPTTAAANLLVVREDQTPQIISFLGLRVTDKLELSDRGFIFPKTPANTTDNTSPETPALSTKLINGIKTNAESASKTPGSIDLKLGFSPNLDILPPPIAEEDALVLSDADADADADAQSKNSVSDGKQDTELSVAVDQNKVEQELNEQKEALFQHPHWDRLAIVPSDNKYKGRFATASAVVNNVVYLLGGYSNNTVKSPARDPNAQNLSDFYSYDPITQEYAQLEDMPVPVDDTVLLPYRDRYIYAISGWHKDGAVNLVQVFDIFKNEWFQASPILGNGVFGHAGGIIDNVILVCDGASMKRNFAAAPTVQVEQSCLLGEIDVTNPSYISWQEWAHPSEQGRFRMAAVSDINNDQICFVGGSTQMYDINGVSSGGQPAQGTSEVWCYIAQTRQWKLSDAPEPSFDHRSAFIYNNQIMTLGGRNQNGIIAKPIVHKTLIP